MFRTEHFEGRLLYETDKVVCINVHINTNYDPNCIFVTQVLLSLVNKKPYFYLMSMRSATFSLTEDDFSTEIYSGIEMYLKNRQLLELD